MGSRLAMRSRKRASASAHARWFRSARAVSRSCRAPTSISGAPSNARRHHTTTPSAGAFFRSVTRQRRSPALPRACSASSHSVYSPLAPAPSPASHPSSPSTAYAKRPSTTSSPLWRMRRFRSWRETPTSLARAPFGSTADTITSALSCDHTYPGPSPPFRVCCVSPAFAPFGPNAAPLPPPLFAIRCAVSRAIRSTMSDVICSIIPSVTSSAIASASSSSADAATGGAAAATTGAAATVEGFEPAGPMVMVDGPSSLVTLGRACRSSSSSSLLLTSSASQRE
mmetsp:Transcript_22983/g.74895  ORF Transcript_22983/g.74895 Transcript_22983/m.74895 type:complete len:283 (-) Transcript_22983:23-871(-)